MNLKGLFNIDNPIMSFLGKIFNLMYLNILTLLCCIPIVTIGAALTAMYYTEYKIFRDSDSSITREFFHSFRQNFRQASLIWLIYAILLIVCFGDMLWIRSGGSSLPPVLFAILVVMSGIIIVEMHYTFGMLSHYENTIAATIKNAWLLSIIHLPKSALIAVTLVASGFLMYAYSYYIAPLIVMFGLTLPAWITTWMLSKIFDRLEQTKVDK